MGYDTKAVTRELHAALQELKQKRQEEGDREPGEFTTAEYSADNDLIHDTGRKALRVLLEAGLVTRRKSRQKSNMYYYRMVKGDDDA